MRNIALFYKGLYMDNIGNFFLVSWLFNTCPGIGVLKWRYKSYKLGIMENTTYDMRGRCAVYHEVKSVLQSSRQTF